VVASKRTARLVRSMKPGRQPDNQEPGVNPSECGHRRVEVIWKTLAVFIPESHETRAEWAIGRGLNGLGDARTQVCVVQDRHRYIFHDGATKDRLRPSLALWKARRFARRAPSGRFAVRPPA